MGRWKNRIARIEEERSGSFGAMNDLDVMNLLFCFSQVNEKSEDWNDLIAKADQFMKKDGEINRQNAARVERVLNDWATGKNSPLRAHADDLDTLRFSGPAYLFHGYNAMKQYFASAGFNLEENLPNLKPETKTCAGKVASASETPVDLSSVEGDPKKAVDFRKFITKGFETAYYYGNDLGSGQKVREVDPYANENTMVRGIFDRLDESLRGRVRSEYDNMNDIREAYDSIKDSKKWYGKDSAEYTGMMAAVRDYTESHKEGKGKGISDDEKQKLEKAIRECSQYLENHSGMKFTSVGERRRDAVQRMLDCMNALPEGREVRIKLAKEKADKERAESTEKKRAEAAQKKAEEQRLKEEQAEEKRQTAKKAPKKPAASSSKKPAASSPKKPAGPVDKDDEWFLMAAALMRQEKAVAESVAGMDHDFRRMDRMMEQYKTMTAKDQARVHDMWVKQFDMGEDTWNMLKKRNGIQEKVAMNFSDLQKEVGEEKPKTGKMTHNVMKEAGKEMKAVKKDPSKSL